MEQRPLRLGDLVEDYCPRERRVTDHAIVAIVNDSIRQTRCTACEAEHVFKGGKAPRRRSTGADSAEQPVDNSGGQLRTPAMLAAEAAESLNGDQGGDNDHGQEEPSAESAPARSSEPAAASPENEGDESPGDENSGDASANEPAWFGHRPLIRATLPRTEGDVPPPRPIPEFTIYQRHNGRGAGGFRGRGGWSDRGQGGNVSRGDRRAGPGFGGQGQGPGQGQGQGRRRHGKRRPR